MERNQQSLEEYMDKYINLIIKMRDGQSSPGSAQKHYLIAAAPRTGSTLLAHLLRRTGKAGNPSEYLISRYIDQPDFGIDEAKKCYDFTIGRYMELLIDKTKSPNGIFGMKEHFFFYESAGMPLEKYNPRYIFITRKDKIMQGISHFRATCSGKFLSMQKESKTLLTTDYSYSEITKYITMAVQYENDWKLYFEKIGVSPIQVVYEEFVSDMNNTVSRVIKEALDIDYSPSDVSSPIMQKQADDLSEYYYEKYMKDKERGLQYEHDSIF